MSKTCGECKCHTNKCHCEKFSCYAGERDFCDEFEPAKKPTNGDKIRQMSNEGIAKLLCGVLNDRREETFRSVLDFLNAPAEREGEDE